MYACRQCRQNGHINAFFVGWRVELCDNDVELSKLLLNYLEVSKESLIFAVIK